MSRTTSQRRGGGQQNGHDAGHGQARPGGVDQPGLDRAVRASAVPYAPGAAGDGAVTGGPGMPKRTGESSWVFTGSIVPYPKREHVVH